MATDIFLYQGESNQNDVKLSDPTVLRSGAVITEKFFFGAKTGYAYFLLGAKLFNLNLGTIFSVENNTDFMINKENGKVMYKLTTKALENA